MFFGLGVDMSADEALAFLTGQMYPPSEFTDRIGEGIDADTAFVVCAGCCASGLWSAACVVFKNGEQPKEMKGELVCGVIEGLADMYKSENQTPLSVTELTDRIFDVWKKAGALVRSTM
jgi:hypothetical protein